MKTGQVEKAERIALNEFDKWNEVTGYFQEHTGYYYEMQAVIKDECKKFKIEIEAVFTEGEMTQFQHTLMLATINQLEKRILERL